jgi:hypothetical protein
MMMWMEQQQCRGKYAIDQAEVLVLLPLTLNWMPVLISKWLPMALLMYDVRRHPTTPIAGAVHDQARQDRQLLDPEKDEQRQSSAGPRSAAFDPQDCMFAC